MKKKVLLDQGMFMQASIQPLAMLNPAKLYRNPVMFIVEIGSILTTALAIDAGMTHSGEAAFGAMISVWLWLSFVEKPMQPN